jgi:hypothetical protein
MYDDAPRIDSRGYGLGELGGIRDIERNAMAPNPRAEHFGSEK